MSPNSPSSRKRFVTSAFGAKRRTYPICRAWPVSCVARTSASASATVTDIGFSTRTSLPARSAASAMLACRRFGTQMLTASTPESTSTSFPTSVARGTPNSSARALARVRSMSQTATSSAWGFFWYESRCCVAIAPTPMTAIRVVMSGSSNQSEDVRERALDGLRSRLQALELEAHREVRLGTDQCQQAGQVHVSVAGDRAEQVVPGQRLQPAVAGRRAADVEVFHAHGGRDVDQAGRGLAGHLADAQSVAEVERDPEVRAIDGVHQPGQPVAAVHEESMVLDRRHDAELRGVVGHRTATFHHSLERRLELPRALFAPRPRGDVVPEDPGAEPVRDVQLPAEPVDLLVLRRSQVAADQVVHDRYADVVRVCRRVADHAVVLQVVLTVHRGDLQVPGRGCRDPVQDSDQVHLAARHELAETVRADS